MDGTILVADDDRTIRTVLTQALTRAGCKVHATSSLITLMRWIEEGRGDLVISDVVMPDGNGLEMLPIIKKIRPDLPVIVISAQNTIETAIQATEAQAHDYMPKPFDLPDLLKRVAKALAQPSKQPRRNDPSKEADDLPLIGRTAAMQAMYRLIAQVMHTDLGVLLSGESGSGKSLVARTIHDYSDRRMRPFVVASATELEDPERAQSVLGRAGSGSLVLDEIGDFSDEAQSRLARMIDQLDDGGPRLMATSQTDLAQRSAQSSFRADLFYRIAGVTIAVPSLRDRLDDIELLAQDILTKVEKDGGPARSLSAEALSNMRRYTWPGNVRQLDHVLRQLALTAQTGEISEVEVNDVLTTQPEAENLKTTASADKLSASVAQHLHRYFDLMGGNLPPPGLYGRILREVEGPLIEIALDATAGNQAKCADLLGINRNTLRKKITDLDIRVTRGRKLM